ncbi:MAG: DUF1836 domain-containing protein [Clostridia bacterium]|nr:DUF1836 domain-containing protein [Clostridia bacterium]
MKREELYQIAEDAVREEELCAGEIPAIDLYVDQIINLVSEKLMTGSERYHDRQLTKTMINNYSKDGLITPVKGKKYNKEQIIQILTIYTLKNTLSIGEIKRLLQGAYASEGFDGNTLIELYDRYLDIKRDNRELSREILDTIMDRNQLEVSEEMGFMLTVGALLSLSAFLRQTAQAMIDVKYPVPEVEEEKKDDKREEKKDKEKAKKDKEKEKEKKKKKEEDQLEISEES